MLNLIQTIDRLNWQSTLSALPRCQVSLLVQPDFSFSLCPSMFQQLRCNLRAIRLYLFALLGWSCTLLLSVLISLFSLSPTTVAQPPQAAIQKQARQANQDGFALLQQGRPNEALSTWQTATRLYRKIGSQDGVIGTQINQSLAMQALGLYPRACTTLIESIEAPDWLCLPFQQNISTSLDSSKALTDLFSKHPPTRVRLIGLRNLGDVLRSLGKLPESIMVLTHAQHVASQLNNPSEQAKVLLELANTHRLLFNQSRDNYLRSDDPNLKEDNISQIKHHANQAVTLYKQAIALSPPSDSTTALQAKLNALSLVVELNYWLQHVVPWRSIQLNELLNTLLPQAVDYATDLLQKPTSFDSLHTINAIYARLNLVATMLKSRQALQFNQALLSHHLTPTWQQLRSLVDQALTQAQQINNPRSQSYALGTLARLLTQTQASPIEIQATYEQALALAQSVQAWDIAYQWQRELGQIYQDQGDRTKATTAYRAAIKSLDQVRGNLTTINPDLQFSFKEKVEPAYRQYMRFLLSQSQPNLSEVVQVNESRQIAELENFLQCGKLDLVPLNQIVTPKNQPAIVHVIDLGDIIGVIVQSIDHTLQHYTINSKSLKDTAENLLANLQSEQLSQTDPAVFLKYAKTLYQIILQPAREQGMLPPTGSLVFVLDTLLQNIPMGLLHDGQYFLVETYSISVAPGFQIREPQSLSSNQLKALIAGLSKASPSFQDPRAPKGLSPLPEVEVEVKSIQQHLTDSVQLLNEDFTAERFQSEISNTVFPIVHVTTHGQFSSNPNRTLLLSWDRLIDAFQLNQLLKAPKQGGQSGIELLVLSACQTAKGDRRSTLGIAGIAAQSGARSTVATLWLVDADSTAALMDEFYWGLQNRLPKSEALRQAQISLIQSPAFNHPYYWAPFILVGSWL